MMVVPSEGQQRSWHPPLDGTPKDPSMPLSSPPSVDGEAVSPLSPLSAHNLFSTGRRATAAPSSRDGEFSSIAGFISSPVEAGPPWMESCWSDATTASAVLSLLHKDPVGSPSDSFFDQEVAPSAPHKTCSVCFENLESDLYPRTSIAIDCDHTSIPGIHICTICLSRSLDMQYSNSQTTLLTCPLCHAQLNAEEVERWASRPTFQAYDMARTWQILEDDADFVRCINPDCGYGQLHVGGLGDPVVICANCGVRTCYVHRNIPWHEGFSCTGFEIIINQSNMASENLTPGLPSILRIGGSTRGQSASEEFLSQMTIQETTRACPSCLVATEKAGGCKYMRCRVCWQEWCWDCGILWERGHLSVDCFFAVNFDR
ncbi:hypothetical protein BJX64DRAFT_202984 [Aspergillus heterothallicus]